MIRPRRPTRLAAPALAATFALLAVHCFISTCDHDEIEHLHASWLVSQGARPFADFVEHHHPTIYWLYAKPAALLGARPMLLVGLCRLVNLALLAGVAWAASRLSSREGGPPWAALLLCGCWTFVRNALEVRPDPWMNLFCVLGLVCWLLYLRAGRWRDAVLSGLCFGIAVAFLQKALVFAGLVAAGSLLIAGQRRTSLRGMLLAAAGAALPLIAFVGYIRAAGDWDGFSFWNYRFNRFFYLRLAADSFSAFPVIAVAALEDPLLWGLGLWGLWAGLRASALQTLCAVIAGGLLLALTQSAMPFQHNLLLLFAPLAIAGALKLQELRRGKLLLACEVAAALMLAKVAVLCLVHDENKGHEVVQQQVLASTSPGDTVSVPPPYHPVARRDAFFFWFDASKKARVYREYCQRYGCAVDRAAEDERRWREAPPAVVYLPRDEPAWWPYQWEEHRARYREVAPGLFERASR